MSRINVLWVIDHVCYDGQLHGGGRLYWNVIPRFDSKRFNIVPCLLRADKTIRKLFENGPVNVRFLDKGKHDVTTLWTFLKLIRNEKIHVMHLHCYGASTFGRLAGGLTGVPTIIHDYDTQVYFPYPRYLWTFDRLLSPMTRKAFAASPMVRDYMIERRAINPRKVTMMFHAVPPEKYAPVSPERVDKAKKSLGIRPDDKVVSIPTKVGPGRGNKYLLRAARLVLQAEPKVFFVMAYKLTRFHRQPDGRYVRAQDLRGKEEAVGELFELASSLGVDQRFLFIDSWESMEDILAMSDCVVAPFLSERFSSVNLLEAMAKGKPIIATDLGEQREFIENGVNGYLVPPGDEEALALKIQQVLGNREELLRLSEQARIKSKDYSLDSFVRRLEGVYAGLASNSTE